MIDLHCHLMPYVDDGAHDLEEAEELLTMEAEQGVTALCLTPHLRMGMFETPDEKIRQQFARLVPLAAAKGLTLSLSREYHWDELFQEKLRAGELIPIGGGVLLTEFSSRHSGEQMLRAVERIRQYGFIPLIAHVERYPEADGELIRQLREAGALIQVNADAVLGLDGLFLKKQVWKLLRTGLVDVVASDAHSTGLRPPRLQACMTLLAKKMGEEQAKALLLHKPKNIIMGKEHDRRE